MSEFKAQILAILLVLGTFGVLNAKFQSFFTSLWDKVETRLNETLASSNTANNNTIFINE
jgi:hypothetical protein